MDIRTKLALALVSVSLLSMFLLGGFAYKVSANLLQQISERQLDALAEAKKQDLLSLIEGWRNDVRLIRSRTQLRKRLRQYNLDGDEFALADIQRIIQDALDSTTDVRRITIFDPSGNALLAAGGARVVASVADNLDNEEVRYAGFYVDQTPHLVFQSRIQLDEETIGGLEVVIAAASLEALAQNYRGLGETGETLVFAEAPGDRYVLLHDLRHGDQLVWSSPPDYVRAAVAGVERLYTEDVRDYRDQLVWAATRSLPEPDWGLVIKIDAEEETARARELRGQLIDLGLALGAFAIVGGTLLGFYLAKPIRELADVVERVHHGETRLRANANSEDEIGLLAETLNNYLDQYGPDRIDEDANDRTA